MYTFIHPTKTGGAACEKFFKQYYNTYIDVKIGHEYKCKNDNNSIIIIRNPISRFISMYNYWKNGTYDSRYKRDEAFKEKYASVTIKDFIILLKTNSSGLHQGFTARWHFIDYSHWINNTDHSNIIVIKYESDLNNKIQTLISSLNIPVIKAVVPLYNRSTISNTRLDKYDLAFIKDYYKKDFELCKKIEDHPEQFKMVI